MQFSSQLSVYILDRISTTSLSLNVLLELKLEMQNYSTVAD